MRRIAFTIARLKKMPRPPEYLDELRAIALQVTDKWMAFDADSAAYLALQIKYARAPQEPGVKCNAEERALLIAIDQEAVKTQPAGLGDTIKYYAERWGADRVATFYEKITGLHCRCESRREWLNRFWPYK